MMCSSALPASSRFALACHLIIGLVVNIHSFVDLVTIKKYSHFSPDLNRLESGWSSSMGHLIVSPSSPPPPYPPTPPPSPWPALTTLRTPTKFRLLYRRLCDAVLFRSPCIFEGALACQLILGLVVNIPYVRRFGHRINPSHFSPNLNRLRPGSSSTMSPPHRYSIF